MIKITTVAIVCLLSVISCSGKFENPILNMTPKVGKGPITDKTYNLDFDGIKVAQSISATVIKSDVEKVVVSAPENILEDVLVEVTAGKVYIHFKPGINISANNVSAKIYAKDFSEIEASSSGSIKVQDKFTQDRTKIKVSSSGTISGELEANEMDIDVSSSGDFDGKIWAVNLDVSASSSGRVSISGKAKNFDGDVSSSGTVNARNVSAENAELEASSSGSVNVSVSETLNAKASSSGSISVKKLGNVRIVETKESSGGSISLQ